MNFSSLKEVAMGDDGELDNERPESRVQITEIDTTKVVSIVKSMSATLPIGWHIKYV